MKQITVGKIVKPQGIKGEVKLLCYVDAPDGFSHVQYLYVDGIRKRVLKARVLGADVYLTLEGVTDRNAAEALRNKEVSIERDQADVLKTGEYFISDLIGLEVVSAGRRLGVIRDVLQHGAADVFDIRGEKNYMAPFLKALVLDIDLEKGVMTVDEAKWREVACEN